MDRIWNAKWISDTKFTALAPIDVYRKELDKSAMAAHLEELQNVHTLFRTSFELDKLPAQAQLYISADDYYKLYINGHFIGQGPAQANYYHYFYNQWDVSPYLQQGENVIAVHVYYLGLISRSYNSGDYRQGMIAELVADGESLLGTDSYWKHHPAEEYRGGEIIAYDTQFTEHIDSRLQLKHWRNTQFNDHQWQNAEVKLADDHRLFVQPTSPLAIKKVKPKLIIPIEGGYWIDFGTELTGQFTMIANGIAGQQVEIRCGEELLPDDRVRYDMRCNCRYVDHWTLSGDIDELELYDYKAFRYVEVLTDPIASLDVDSFAVIVRHYPFDEEACTFHSSHPLLNSIWDICKNGVKLGTQENYVDCPTREKGQYLGDNTIITHAHAYLSGDLTMYRKSLEDFAFLSARVCPGLMAVAPGHFMQEIADFSLQYPYQLWQYYRFSGDREFLQAMFPIAQQMMDYFARYRRSDGLLDSVNEKWNLVDWPENLRDGYQFELKREGLQGCHNVINAFYYGALHTMEEIRSELGMATNSQEELQQTLLAFRDSFYDAEQRLFVDTEGSQHASLHGNVLPLLFGLCPDEAVPAIVGLIAEKRLSCGVYMSYFVLKALAKAQSYDLVYELITSDDLHSWSTMVKEGATTCFEAWSKDLKWNTSLCHAWASAPVPLFIEEICGIKPAAPGWTKVSFKPQVPQTLSYISLSFQTTSGQIRFVYENGQSQLILPDGVQLIEPSKSS